MNFPVSPFTHRGRGDPAHCFDEHLEPISGYAKISKILRETRSELALANDRAGDSDLCRRADAARAVI